MKNLFKSIVLSGLIALAPFGYSDPNKTKETETVQEQPKPLTCNEAKEALGDCQRVIFFAEVYLNAQQEVIENQEKQISDLDKLLAEKDQLIEARDPWYLSAEFVGPVLFVLGVVVGQQASR